MVVIDLHPLGTLPQADFHGPGAPGGKGTSGRHIQQVDGGAGDGLEPLAIAIQRGNGVEQSLGVFMLWVIENLVSGALLADGAGVHDDDLVTHLGHNAQIVGDHDDGHAQLLL